MTPRHAMVVHFFGSVDTNPEQVYDQLLARCLPGRYLALFWQAYPHVPAQALFDARLVQRAIVESTDANELRDAAEVEFFGNLFVRSYDQSGDDTSKKEYHGVIFRSANGPQSYRLRTDLSPEALHRADLDTKAYAFTRDYCNNVWHVLDEGVEARVAKRLAYLLAWPGENALLSHADEEHIFVLPVKLEGDLVPVAKKTLYEWPDALRGQESLFADDAS